MAGPYLFQVMHMRPPPFCLALALAAIAVIAAAPRPLRAQEGTVGGVVLGESSRLPLADVQVRVRGTRVPTLTDAAGRFRLIGLAGEEVVLEFRRIGYRPATVTARAGDLEVRVLLAEKVLDLDAVVVTGTPVETERRALGNAVATINAAQVVETAPVQSLQDLLNARAPNVVPHLTSGNVGTGARLRVRGASSLGLSNQPLLYIDGVRVNNAVATGPVNQAFGSASISRLNDLNPEDIETIEVIKGPAAATLYGTEASNGVIQIITKRGASGAARWAFTAKQGGNFLRNPEGRIWLNYQIDTLTGSPTKDSIISLDIVEREAAAGRPIWRTGQVQEYNLSVGGGTPEARYYLGGGYEDTDGADKSNNVERYNTRASVQVTPSEKTNVGLSLGYITGRTTLPCEAGCGGRIWSAVLADPRSLTGPNARRRGFHSGLPEEYDLLTQFWQDVDRFTASLQLGHEPTPWLRHRLNFGVDRTREVDVSFTPRVDSLVSNPVWGTGALGGKSVNDRRINLATVDYAASAAWELQPGLRATTAIGGQYYRSATDFVFASGSVFPAPGLSAVSATTQNKVNAQDFVEEKSLGFFVQEQVAWQNRLFFTAALRSDDHSAFGANFDRVYYPKVSASWVVSDEAFWRVPLVEELRVRAAYGESGLQPTTFSALRTYAPVTGPLDSAAVMPQFLGNPDLGPERGKEIELGFDAGGWDGRFGVEFTYYRKRVTNAILFRETAPSVGFPSTQPFNAGAVLNKGIELQVRGRPYERPSVSVEVTLGLSTNNNKILDLDPANPDPNEFASVGTYLRHQVGYPVGSWFEQRVVSAQFDALGIATNVMCDDGQGGMVLCRGADGVFGTTDDAPEVYLGRTLPNFEGAFATTVTLYRRLRVYAMLDFRRGYRKLDGNTRVRCNFFGGRCRENFYPLEFDPTRIAGIQSVNSQPTSPLAQGTNLVDYLIDDAGFTKLREVSVSYTLPDAWAHTFRATRATVSLAGRNLHTWTKFGGLEPEAMFLGGSRGGDFSAWEQTLVPQLGSWVFTVNLAF